MYHNKEDRRSVLSKNMLYRALSKKMRDKDFQSITIKEVVETAQMGRSTFYRNFDRIEDILRWKCDETFDALFRYVLQSVKPQQVWTSGEKYPFILPFFRFFQPDSEIIERLTAANRIDLILSAFEDTMRQFTLHYNPAMTHSPYFEYVLAFRSGAVIQMLLKWIQTGKKLSPEQLYRIIEAQSEGFPRKPLQ